MLAKQHEQQVRHLLVEAITVLCQSSLPFSSKLSIQGLLGITLDDKEVLLIDICQSVHSDHHQKLYIRNADSLIDIEGNFVEEEERGDSGENTMSTTTDVMQSDLSQNMKCMETENVSFQDDNREMEVEMKTIQNEIATEQDMIMAQEEAVIAEEEILTAEKVTICDAQLDNTQSFSDSKLESIPSEESSKSESVQNRKNGDDSAEKQSNTLDKPSITTEELPNSGAGEQCEEGLRLSEEATAAILDERSGLRFKEEECEVPSSVEEGKDVPMKLLVAQPLAKPISQYQHQQQMAVGPEKVRGSQKRKRRTPVCVINLSESSDEDPDYTAIVPAEHAAATKDYSATLMEEDTATHSFDSGCEMDQVTVDLTNSEEDEDASRTPTGLQDDPSTIYLPQQNKNIIDGTKNCVVNGNTLPNNTAPDGSISAHQAALQYINQYSASSMQAAVAAFQQQVSSQPEVFSTRYVLSEASIASNLPVSSQQQENSVDVPSGPLQNCSTMLSSPINLPSPTLQNAQMLLSPSDSSQISSLWQQSSRQSGLPPGGTTTRGGKHKCVTCGKEVASVQGLIIHYRTHTGEKPHRCAFCGKRLSTLQGLQVHERIHTGERPYVCVSCGKGFNDKSNQKRHTQHCRPSQPQTPFISTPLTRM